MEDNKQKDRHQEVNIGYWRSVGGDEGGEGVWRGKGEAKRKRKNQKKNSSSKEA